jgi:endonuclease-3 related protein
VKKSGWLHLLQKKDSFEIYKFLEKQDLLSCRDRYWWPNVGSFEVVVGTILTQNTTWKNVEKSLKKLDRFLELESFLSLDEQKLKELIKSSGFYNQKAPRLLKLAQNIKDEFRTFKNFQNKVSREWLLQQKGIGKESADSIMLYAGNIPTFVVDAYTYRMAERIGVQDERDYDALKRLFESAVKRDFRTYNEYHALIVELGKRNCGTTPVCAGCPLAPICSYHKKL